MAHLCWVAGAFFSSYRCESIRATLTKTCGAWCAPETRRGICGVDKRDRRDRKRNMEEASLLLVGDRNSSGVSFCQELVVFGMIGGGGYMAIDRTKCPGLRCTGVSNGYRKWAMLNVNVKTPIENMDGYMRILMRRWVSI